MILFLPLENKTNKQFLFDMIRKERNDTRNGKNKANIHCSAKKSCCKFAYWKRWYYKGIGIISVIIFLILEYLCNKNKMNKNKKLPAMEPKTTLSNEKILYWIWNQLHSRLLKVDSTIGVCLVKEMKCFHDNEKSPMLKENILEGFVLCLYRIFFLQKTKKQSKKFKRRLWKWKNVEWLFVECNGCCWSW